MTVDKFFPAGIVILIKNHEAAEDHPEINQIKTEIRGVNLLRNGGVNLKRNTGVKMVRNLQYVP
jgi:hypothetical protein